MRPGGHSMELPDSMEAAGALVDVDALAAAVAERLSSAPVDAPDLVDADQAGALLGVSVSWVRAEARAEVKSRDVV